MLKPEDTEGALTASGEPCITQSMARALAAKQQRTVDLIQSYADVGQLVKPGLVGAFATIVADDRETMLRFAGLDTEGNPLT